MHRYKIIKKLGDGSQGVAYLASDLTTPRTVVVKKLPSGSRSTEEMRLGKHIKHPNIIECYDAFEENDFVYLAMHYAEGGDLESFLDCLREANEVPPLAVSLRWFTQIATACLHCHGCQLIHRDVKPSNVFLSKDLKTAYLGDFGVAKQLGATKTSTSTFVGSPVWLAPEVVSGQAYDAHSDGWGLGCVLYELVTGKSPFDATNFAALVMRICSGEYDDLPPTVPSHIRSAIAGLLTVDTKQRWSVAKVLASHEDFDVNLPLPPGFGVASPKEGLQTWINARSSLTTHPLPEDSMSLSGAPPRGRQVSRPGWTTRSSSWMSSRRYSGSYPHQPHLPPQPPRPLVVDPPVNLTPLARTGLSATLWSLLNPLPPK
jgi:serine/threonine protein kinase